MATNYVQPGVVLTLVAPAAVESGDVVIVGSIIGVAQGDAASGAAVDVAVLGVWTLPKDNAAIGEGVKTYWVTATSVCSATSAGNTLIGVAVAAAADSASTVDVRLNGTF